MNFLEILSKGSFLIDDKPCKKFWSKNVWFGSYGQKRVFSKNQNILQTRRDIDLILFIKVAPLKTQIEFVGLHFSFFLVCRKNV